MVEVGPQAPAIALASGRLAQLCREEAAPGAGLARFSLAQLARPDRRVGLVTRKDQQGSSAGHKSSEISAKLFRQAVGVGEEYRVVAVQGGLGEVVLGDDHRQDSEG